MFWSIFHGNHDHWGVSNVHAWIEKHLYRHFFLSGYFWFLFLLQLGTRARCVDDGGALAESAILDSRMRHPGPLY